MTPRIYIIGSGVISHPHAMARAELPGSELHAADPSEEARASFLEAFPDFPRERMILWWSPPLRVGTCPKH